MADQPHDHDVEVEFSTPSGLTVSGDGPYRLLVIANLIGSDDGSISGPLHERIVQIDAGSFDDVMAEAAPSVGFTAADPVAPDKAMVEINLRFESLRAFDPKNLIAQLPAAKCLMSARDQIVQRLLGRISSDQLIDGIGGISRSDGGLGWLPDALKWTPAPASPTPDAVDSLLSQIDLGDASGDAEAAATPPPKSPIGAIVAAAADSGASLPAEEASALRRTLAEIDSQLQQWLTAVLHAPQVQSIEAAWRSLAFLVSRIDFRKGIRLSLLHASSGQLNERVRSLLIDPVFDEGADAPDLIVADCQFGSSAQDMEDLDELAQHAASLPAVVLAGVSCGFFGVKHAWQVPTLPTLNTMFDQWQFAKWKSLRAQPYAQALGVIFGRCLLRAPHAASPDAGNLEFAYREPVVADGDLLWAAGTLAPACAVARSVADTGWPTSMAGVLNGRVAGFSSALGGKSGNKEFGPSDTRLNQAKIEEMALVGINPVVTDQNNDEVIVWNGLSAARIAKLEPSALLEVSLPYQLFATRMSSLLFLLKPHLAGKSSEQIVPFVRDHILSWLPEDAAKDPEMVKVQTGSPEGDSSTVLLAVTVTPPPRVLAGGIPIVLGYRLN